MPGATTRCSDAALGIMHLVGECGACQRARRPWPGLQPTSSEALPEPSPAALCVAHNSRTLWRCPGRCSGPRPATRAPRARLTHRTAPARAPVADRCRAHRRAARGALSLGCLTGRASALAQEGCRMLSWVGATPYFILPWTTDGDCCQARPFGPTTRLRQ
eukprot:366112-Chlamydomonas_euryale.AAC.24